MAKSWCEKTVEELKAKLRNGELLTEEEWESLNYAKGVLISEEAERDYCDGYRGISVISIDYDYYEDDEENEEYGDEYYD